MLPILYLINTLISDHSLNYIWQNGNEELYSTLGEQTANQKFQDLSVQEDTVLEESIQACMYEKIIFTNFTSTDNVI